MQNPELTWSTKYWCTLPMDPLGDPRLQTYAANKERLASCGPWSETLTYLEIGFGFSFVYVLVLSAFLEWTRKWSDLWGLFILVVPSCFVALCGAARSAHEFFGIRDFIGARHVGIQAVPRSPRAAPRC